MKINFFILKDTRKKNFILINIIKNMGLNGKVRKQGLVIFFIECLVDFCCQSYRTGNFICKSFQLKTLFITVSGISLAFAIWSA